MTKSTGGPAFPTGTGVTPYNPGMTLRDYFAAKVIDKLLPVCKTNQSAAEESYLIADAMLKAREV